MNVAGTRKDSQAVNVLPLFDTVAVPDMNDPMEELLREAFIADEDDTEEFFVERRRNIVSETQFADQSMYTLDKQLAGLKEKLNRIKFYLGDIDDLLPR